MLTAQHRLLDLDICVSKKRKKCPPYVEPRIKWWNLKEEKVTVSGDKLIQMVNWSTNDNLETM